MPRSIYIARITAKDGSPIKYLMWIGEQSERPEMQIPRLLEHQHVIGAWWLGNTHFRRMTEMPGIREFMVSVLQAQFPDEEISDRTDILLEYDV